MPLPAGKRSLSVHPACKASRHLFSFSTKTRATILQAKLRLPMEHSTEILYNRTTIYCTPVHRFGTDALLLAHTRSRVRPAGRRFVFGLRGGGPGMARQGPPGPLSGPGASARGQRPAGPGGRRPGISHIRPVCADLRTWTPDPEEAGHYDLAACNPPYFTAGPASPDPARAAARHEGSCTLADVCDCAFRLLRDGGKLTLCHRPERLAEVLATLREHRLEPKRLAFVRSRPRRRPLAVSGGRPEKPPHRAAAGAGYPHQRRGGPSTAPAMRAECCRSCLYLDIFIFIFIFIFIVNAFSKPWILQVLPGQTSLHRVKTIRRHRGNLWFRRVKPMVLDAAFFNP